MQNRWKLAYYSVVVSLGVATFFGLVSLPKDWGSILSWLTPLETWWAAHAAHPTLAAFVSGLAVGTIFLPELWSQVKPHLWAPKYRPDVDGATIFKEILAKSSRAKKLVCSGTLKTPLMYESHLTEAGIIEERLKQELDHEFHDLLRLGEITAWGSPDGKKPHQEIKPEEWSSIEISFDDQDMNYDPPHVHAIRRGNRSSGSQFGYLWVKFCRKQILTAFPLALWPRRIKNVPLEKPFVSAKI